MKALPLFPSPAFPDQPSSPTRPWNRRQFLLASAAFGGGCGLCGPSWRAFAAPAAPATPALISPGCRGSKVRVARIYLGKPKAHWPTPSMELELERSRYDLYVQEHSDQFKDVCFLVNQVLTDKADLAQIKHQLKDVDGVLLIHLSMGVRELVEEILTCQRPTALFASPYSGHEWTQFGDIQQRRLNGQFLECYLSGDLAQLAVAIRPFRAIHHLREAKILNLTTRPPSAERVAALRAKFGTEVQTVELDRVLAAYEKVDAKAAAAETRRWIWHAEKVVEPDRAEINRSCRLALAFQQILDEERATALMVDCYGTMYRKLPAFPCVGFVRMNDLGFAGICESDLTSAMTFILLQGLSGRPGFISDPTMDEASGSIILAHCLGTRKMDGPDGKPAPYQLRSIMEREEGCVPQVRMRTGQVVTQALLPNPNQIVYFTGEIIGTPESERGCRTKITVKVDGDPARLWQNWSHGLHRVTCYGDLAEDLNRFCRYNGMQLINEAA